MSKKDLIYKIALNNPEGKDWINSQLHEKVHNLMIEKKSTYDLFDVYDDHYIVEGVMNPKHTKVKTKNAYFIHNETGQIVKLKSGWSHSKAIAIDVTRNGKVFGIKRDKILPIVQKIGFETVSDFVHGEEEYSAEILSLAAENGWARVNVNKDGTVDIQHNSYKEIANTMKVISKTLPMKTAYVELYSHKNLHLMNPREIDYFIRTGGKYKRMELGDFH